MTAATLVSLPDGAESVWTAAHAADARRPRSLQTRLGASDTVCARRAGYILHGTPPTDTPDKRAALIGTYIHDGTLTAARVHAGWQVERLVETAELRGHIDVVHLDAATAARLPRPMRPKTRPARVITVEDVKTKSTYAWDNVLRYGPSVPELRQVYLYAGMLRAVGFADVKGQKRLAALGPIDVGRIQFRFINRDNGDEKVWPLTYDPRQETSARWWVENVRASESPEELPREHEGPGLSGVCDGCPFKTRCWEGAAPGAAPQSVLVHDDQERAEVIAEYVRVGARARRLKKRQEFLRAVIDRSDAGVYGPNVLVWSGGNPAFEVDVEGLVDWYELAGLPVPLVPDRAAMVAVLKKAGVAVPRRRTDGLTPIQIKVKPAPKV